MRPKDAEAKATMQIRWPISICSKSTIFFVLVRNSHQHQICRTVRKTKISREKIQTL